MLFVRALSLSGVSALVIFNQVGSRFAPKCKRIRQYSVKELDILKKMVVFCMAILRSVSKFAVA